MKSQPVETSIAGSASSLAGAQEKMGLRFDARTRQLSESVETSLTVPLGLTFIDMAWGTLVSGIAATVGKLVLDDMNK